MADLISRAAAIARIDKCVALSGIGLEPVMAVRDIKTLISVMPTIDAIPVEWLEDRVYDMKRAPLYRRYAEMLLMEWLQEQKEQEAQDE